MCSAASVKSLSQIPGFPWPTDSAVTFTHVEGAEESIGNIWSNWQDVTVVEKAVTPILRAQGRGHVRAEEVGVIAPYDAQRQALRRRLPNGVPIASVDGGQGQDRTCSCSP